MFFQVVPSILTGRSLGLMKDSTLSLRLETTLKNINIVNLGLMWHCGLNINSEEAKGYW